MGNGTGVGEGAVAMHIIHHPKVYVPPLLILQIIFSATAYFDFQCHTLPVKIKAAHPKLHLWHAAQHTQNSPKENLIKPKALEMKAIQQIHL